MEDVHIFEGKTTTEAIEKGLKELKTSKDKVEIKVLENDDKRSFFNILTPRVVKVEIKFKNNASKEIIKEERKEISNDNFIKAKQNLENFFENFKKNLPTKDIEIKINKDNAYILVEFQGKELNYLIGYRGEVLNSLQRLLSSIASRENEEKITCILDIEGYREKRKKILEDLADKLAKRVVESKRNKTLEPMSSYERKIIHSRLQNHPHVTTQSIGEEPNRRIVINYKK